MRNGDDGHHLAAAARKRVALPSAPDQDEALLLQEAVAGGVGGGGPDVEERGDQLVSAVHDVIDQRVVALAQVDRLQDGERHRVLDVPTRVPRRSLDVLDDPVAGMARIDLPGDRSIELFVRSCATERSGAVRRAGGEGDARDFRADSGRERQQGEQGDDPEAVASSGRHGDPPFRPPLRAMEGGPGPCPSMRSGRNRSQDAPR